MTLAVRLHTAACCSRAPLWTRIMSGLTRVLRYQVQYMILGGNFGAPKITCLDRHCAYT
jgi:hypothetical protein